RPWRHHVRHAGAGGAEFLARPHLDDRPRSAFGTFADLRHRHLAAFCNARHRARLHGHSRPHAADALGHDRCPGLRLHPHRARQGFVRGQHPLQAGPAQRRHSRGVDRRRPAWLHAGRFDRHRNGVRAARRGLSRLGKHCQERFSRGAGGRPGTGDDLHRPHLAGRYSERAVGAKAANRMTAPVVVQAVQASRVAKTRFVIGMVIVAVIAVAALIGNALVPQDPFAQDLGQRLLPPFWMDGNRPEHLFGTDQLGRDYLARLVYGARISLLIGIMTVITSGLIGTTLGVLGGFFGGRIDDVVLFAITTRLSIPVVLVALAVVGLMGSGLGLVVATLGLLLWDRFAVVARASTMQVRTLDYVSAAWCAGASTPHVLIREILP